jgi:hypothetical protein
MTRDSFPDFTDTVAPDFDADLDAAFDRFIDEGRPDFDRIIRSSTPTDWTLGDPDFFSVPDLEPTWSDL